MTRVFFFILSYFAAFISSARAEVDLSRNSGAKRDKSMSGLISESEEYSLTRKGYASAGMIEEGLKENAFDAPLAVHIIKSEEIRRSGATSIPEILRLVPGIQVSRIDGNKWAITVRGFNAQFSNKLLVMIDGRSVYTPLFSGVFWDTMDYILEDIDRVEVIRGPGGTIWGANAVNGVINIITRKAIGTQGAYASVTTGNLDKFIGEARYGGQTKSGDYYRIYAKSSDHGALNRTRSDVPGQDGTSNHDGYSQNQVGFRYDIKNAFGEKAKLMLEGDAFQSKADRYASNLNGTGDYTNKGSKGGNININYDQALSLKSNFSIQSYFDYNSINSDLFDRDAATFNINYQHFYNTSLLNQFSWGLGYRSVRDRINEGTLTSPSGSGQYKILDYTPDNQTFDTYSGFLQDRYWLIKHELEFTVGSKFERNSYTKFEYQPNARLAYYPTDNQTIWTSVSRAIRVPTRGERTLTLTKEPGTIKEEGNQRFNSENLLSYELGYRIKPTDSSSIDIATFYNEYRSLHTYEYQNTGSFMDENLGTGKSYGGDITGKVSLTQDWKLEAGYDFIKMELRAKPSSNDDTYIHNLEQFEASSPRHQFQIHSYYNFTPKLEFDNVFYYVSALPFKGGMYNGTVINTIPAYTRFDTRLGYFINKNFELSTGIQNLFGKEHEEFYAPLASYATKIGRTFYVKLAYRN